MKDNRAYLERRHGHERTEYLGARSSDNRVKLYNKQVESKLGYPLTRLELTLNPEVPFENIRFPTVYCIQTMQTTLDEQIRVTDTERFIIGAILQGYGSVTDLGRKTRDKITRLLADYVKEVRITPQDYDAILHQLRGYIAGQAQTEATEKDRPPDVPGWVREADQREPGELPP